MLISDIQKLVLILIQQRFVVPALDFIILNDIFIICLHFNLGYTSHVSIGNHWNEAIAPVTNIQLQLGMVLILPIILLTSLEHGLGKAMGLMFTMIAKFAVFYYNFMGQS